MVVGGGGAAVVVVGAMVVVVVVVVVVVGVIVVVVVVAGASVLVVEAATVVGAGWTVAMVVEPMPDGADPARGSDPPHEVDARAMTSAGNRRVRCMRGLPSWAVPPCSDDRAQRYRAIRPNPDGLRWRV
jgi:hypothetical protein